MLPVGSPAPDFFLRDQDGQCFHLSDVLKAGPVVLYFYPADFTPGCTREACSFRDMEQDLAAAGLRVVGISPQSAETHRRFRASLSLNFTLLVDSDKAVIRAYDADGPLGLGVRRMTYAIGSHGRIDDVLLADFRVGKHETFVRNAMQATQS
jgi:thioredoxin-dependent peroxiredoxin